MKTPGSLTREEWIGRIAVVLLAAVMVGIATVLEVIGYRLGKAMMDEQSGPMSMFPAFLVVTGVLLDLAGVVFLILPFLPERLGRPSPPRGFPTVSRAFDVVWSALEVVGRIFGVYW